MMKHAPRSPYSSQTDCPSDPKPSNTKEEATTRYTENLTRPRSQQGPLALAGPAGTPTSHPCSPRGGPKNAAFSEVSATSMQLPSIATIRRPAGCRRQPGTPHASPVSRSAWRPGRTTPPTASTPAGRAPERSPTSTATCSSPPNPKPTTAHRSTGSAPHPHTSPRCTAPSRSQSTPSPAPATTDDAARYGPLQRSPHCRPNPAGTPGSAPPPTPDRTTVCLTRLDRYRPDRE